MEVRDLGRELHHRRVIGRQHFDRVGHVLLGRESLVADEPAGFEEHAIGHRQLADVVDACGLRELRALDLRETHACADRLGIERDASTMIARARIADVDHLGERIERRVLDGEDRFVQRLRIRVRGAGLGLRLHARSAQRD